MGSFWENKRVVITGGSSGLGKALATELCERAAKVVVVARSSQRLNDLNSQLPLHVIEADISNKLETYRIAGTAAGVLGGIDVLINNASYLGPTPLRMLLDTDCEDLAAVLETNLIGPFRLTKAIIPSMLLSHNGLVVNVSSDAAVSAYPNWGSYSISKAALDHLTRIWSEELSLQGIEFLAIDPGDMYTPMHMAAIPDANPTELAAADAVATALLQFLAETRTTPSTVRFAAHEWRCEK